MKDKPAFPFNFDVNDDGRKAIINAPGLTKREYFAGLAMQGLCADFGQFEPLDDSENIVPALMKESVAMADALLEELAKDE